MYSLFTWLNLQILNLCWHIESCRHMKTHRVLNRSRKCAFTINSRSKLKTFSASLLRHLLRFHGGPFELKTLEIFTTAFLLKAIIWTWFFSSTAECSPQNQENLKKDMSHLKTAWHGKRQKKKIETKKRKRKKIRTSKTTTINIFLLFYFRKRIWEN